MVAKGFLRLSLVFIQLAVLHRFGDMQLQCHRFRKIGNGSRHFQDAMISSCGKIQPADGLLEQVFPCIIRHAIFIDFLDRQLALALPCRCQLALMGLFRPVA